MSSDNHLDDVSLSFLEGFDDTPEQNGASDSSVLEKALDYNVNLEDMENISPADNLQFGVPSEEVKIVSAPVIDDYIEDVPQKNLFEKIDVHLQDIIDKCFRNSERPIVIIRDDKVIYGNAAFLRLVNIDNPTKILNHNFMEYVVKDYWNIVAENIGEALTTTKSIQIGIKDSVNNLHKVNFDAVYIPDNHTFSFILIGEHLEVRQSEALCLYDTVTGLPTYYLLEDRIQTIINSKNNKDISFGKEITALIGIAIDNIDNFDRLGNTNLILKRLTSRVGLSLNKNYTLARGLKFQFWVLIPNIDDYESLETEVNNIKTLFDDPVEDNFSRYEIKTSIGVSTFPEPATSGKKLIEQATMSVEKAQKDGGNKVIIFGA